MKIAILSDTHSNWPTFEKAINWIKKENIPLILHCGDISDQETIDNARKLFGDEFLNSNTELKGIKFVKGNTDFELDIPEKMELEIKPEKFQQSSLKIAFAHFPDIAKKLAQSGNFDLVFYGHTHRAWDEKIGGCRLINPGELTGHFYKPTFAVYDTETKNLELKILEKI